MHKQAPFAALGASCPNAESTAQRSVALPVHSELDDEKVRFIAEQIRGYFTVQG